MAVGDQIDSALQSALKKLRAGNKDFTQREESALQKHEKKLREKYGPAYFESLPKTVACKLLGTSSKVALDFHDRFDVPWEPHAKTVDLGAVARHLWGMLARHSAVIFKAEKAAKSRRAVEEFFPDAGENRDWQEECWKERALEFRDKRLLREESMLDADAVAKVTGRIADGWRDFGERLGKRFGPDAQQMFLETTRDIERDVAYLLGDDGDGSRDDAHPQIT